MKSVFSLQSTGSLSLLTSTVRKACLAWMLLASASSLIAADRATEFLEGLRERGWHDVALDYLDSAQEDPIVTDEFLARIDFERALSQAALAKEDVGERRRSTLLEQATTGLQQFAASNPESPYYIEALSQAGKLLAERALLSLVEADRFSEQATSAREEYFVAARELFDEAAATVQTMLSACASQLESLPNALPPQDEDAAQSLGQSLQTKQAEGKFLLATLNFEKARTYESGSSQYHETLTKAAKQFAELSQLYEGRVVGSYSRLYEGRCYQQTGETQAALECYDDLVSQPSGEPMFRALIARAYRRRAECHLLERNFDQAIEECRDWLNDARGDERSQEEWLAVAFRLASAYQAKAEEIGASGDASRLQNEARKLFRDISREPGEFQTQARTALASVNEQDEPIEAVSFDEAFAAGRDALERMNSSKLAVKLAAKNNPEAVEALKDQAAFNKQSALRFLEKAVSLAGEEAPAENLVTARYYLCWLYWEDERLQDAAETGEVLARQHSEHPHASAAARLALAAYEKLYLAAQKTAGTEDNDSTSKQLVGTAEFIVKRWPESDGAAGATKLLINIALEDNRLTEAEQLLAKLPENQRASAQLNLGSSMWTRYLRMNADDSTTENEQAEKWKQQAGEFLWSGFQNLSKRGNATASEATEVLYLVQLLLDQRDFDRAIEVLEDPTVGSLAHLRRNASEEQRPDIAIETYKAGLRAYVLADPPQHDKAQQMMDALEDAVQGQPDAEKQLSNIYVSLGLQLQQQISALSSAGDADKARALTDSFKDLLARITARGGASDWQVRNWIAHTNLQLGESSQKKNALEYLKLAETAYREILAQAEKEPDFAPNELAVLGVRKRLGDCLAALQKFESAFAQYTEILEKKPAMLELQKATAKLLQQWGRESKNLEKLEQAIRGALPQENKKHLVWGWLQLAKIADAARKRAEADSGSQPADQSKIAKYDALFFEARYNAAKSRFDAAQLVGGADRKKQLRTARQSVEAMKRLYPDLGGAKWKDAFDHLLQQIEEQSRK